MSDERRTSDDQTTDPTEDTTMAIDQPDSGRADSNPTEQLTERIELPDKDSREAAAATRAIGTTEPTPAWEPQPTVQPATQPGVPAYHPQAERPPAPTGPHAPAIILGAFLLVAAVIAGYDGVVGLDVDWTFAGPVTVVVLGGVLVLLGAIGLASNRQRSAGKG